MNLKVGSLGEIPACPLPESLRTPVDRPERPRLVGRTPAEIAIVLMGFSLEQEGATSRAEAKTSAVIAIHSGCEANNRALNEAMAKARRPWFDPRGWF